jgi:GTP pyrophosphokinase
LVTKRDGVDYKDENGVNISNYLNNILSDVRACLVKTADRKHNFSTLDSTSAKHEARQMFETEKYFIPFFKESRKIYPEYSAYFHSAKTTIVPHLKRIKKAIEAEEKLKLKLALLEEKLVMQAKHIKALEKKIRSGQS